MRELFEICRKIQVFFNFLCFFRFEGVNLLRKGVKKSVLMFQGQPGNIPSLNPRKMTIFLHLALYFHLSLPQLWHSHLL